MMHLKHLRMALAGLGSLACVHGALAEDAGGKRVPAWSNDFTARVEALALLQT